jgi:SAM-dependent methyltransferase
MAEVFAIGRANPLLWLGSLRSPTNSTMHARKYCSRFQELTRRALLSTASMWPAVAARASDDEAVWAQYLSWLEGRAVGDTVGLESYRKVLTGQGLPKAEVERRMTLIAERAFKRPEAMRLWFNSMYGPDGAVGPDWPTPFVMEVVKDLTPGAALDVCMGEGRNSIFLATLGWKVTGFDVSDVALVNARAKAKKAGVNLTTVRSGYQEFDFGHGRWDLIVMTYAYFPIRNTEYVNRLIESMRPGGLLAFRHGVLKKGVDRTGTASLLGIPEEGELKVIFRSLRVLRYEEVEEQSDWQVGHVPRKERSVKMLARKP